ncbi:hypothetical protein LTS10_000889 [Elasticomyces elasticus]|nr:hypothetical protein LTS10_000889 [Elasticomyces elasticus]
MPSTARPSFANFSLTPKPTTPVNATHHTNLTLSPFNIFEMHHKMATSSSTTPALLRSPTELKDMILGYLDVADLPRVRLVNKEFNDIVVSHRPIILSELAKNHKNRLQRALDGLDFTDQTLLYAILAFDNHFAVHNAEREQKSVGLQVFAKWYYTQNKHRSIFVRCKNEAACKKAEAYSVEAACVEERNACNELSRLALFVLQQIYPSDTSKTKMVGIRTERAQEQLGSKLRSSSALYNLSNPNTASEFQTMSRQLAAQFVMPQSRSQTSNCWRQTYHIRNVQRLSTVWTEKLVDLLPSLPGHRHLQYCMLPNRINTALVEKLAEGKALSGKEKAVLMGDILVAAVEGSMSMRWGIWLGEKGAALRYCL